MVHEHMNTIEGLLSRLDEVSRLKPGDPMPDHIAKGYNNWGTLISSITAEAAVAIRNLRSGATVEIYKENSRLIRKNIEMHELILRAANTMLEGLKDGNRKT